MQHTHRMDIFVIGAMKAATSTICAFLEDHPDVHMVPHCEPNFFSWDENYARGVEWYHSHLDAAPAELRCGEGSNYYSARDMYPDSAARMAAYNPNAKIVYMARHPLDRIVSAWLQNRRNNRDMIPPTLDQAVRELPDRFIGQSRYWHNISAYRDHFSDDQIFVGFMEDLNRTPATFYADLCAFLEITPKETADRGHQNQTIGKRIPSKNFTRLNSLPLVQSVKPLLPSGLKRTIADRLLSEKVSKKPEFSAQTRQELMDELRPDSEAFLAQYGKAADFWDMT